MPVCGPTLRARHAFPPGSGRRKRWGAPRSREPNPPRGATGPGPLPALAQVVSPRLRRSIAPGQALAPPSSRLPKGREFPPPRRGREERGLEALPSPRSKACRGGPAPAALSPRTRPARPAPPRDPGPLSRGAGGPLLPPHARRGRKTAGASRATAAPPPGGRGAAERQRPPPTPPPAPPPLAWESRRCSPPQAAKQPPFSSAACGKPEPADVEMGAGTLPPPAAITSGTKTSPSPRRARASQPLHGADGGRGPLKKQQAPPSSSQPGSADPLAPPALHLRKRGRSLGEDLASLRPLRHFIAPLPDLPPPEAAGAAPGGGQAGDDWQGGAPPLRGWSLTPAPQPRPPHRLSPSYWLHLFASHRPARPSAAPDFRPPRGDGCRPSKPSDELS